MRMLDLFCGRLGWSKAFLARGWECVGVDLVEPAEIPQGFTFIQSDIMDYLGISPVTGVIWFGNHSRCGPFDFICASSPCEEFSVHGMKHFHPNPKYPENGIRLFNHTREICEASGVPYVMENVRPAQEFVGRAVHHCGPFYLWGTGVPALMPQGVSKGHRMLPGGLRVKLLRAGEDLKPHRAKWEADQKQARGNRNRKELIASTATIPPELASCIADYAERLLLTTTEVAGSSGQTDPVDINSGDAS